MPPVSVLTFIFKGHPGPSVQNKMGKNNAKHSILGTQNKVNAKHKNFTKHELAPAKQFSGSFKVLAVTP